MTDGPWVGPPMSDEHLARHTPRQQALIRVVEQIERNIRALNPHPEKSLLFPLTFAWVDPIERAIDAVVVEQVPEGWVNVASLPKGKYIVTETEDGWDVYCEDDHGAFS